MSGKPSLLELSRVRRRKTKPTDEGARGEPSLLELSRVRRRKTEVNRRTNEWKSELARAIPSEEEDEVKVKG